jgi:hypothetical protein
VVDGNAPAENTEFGKDSDIVSEKVLNLLRRYPDKEFWLEELMSRISDWPPALVWDAIDFLRKEGRLKRRRINGNCYYSAKRSHIRHS